MWGRWLGYTTNWFLGIKNVHMHPDIMMHCMVEKLQFCRFVQNLFFGGKISSILYLGDSQESWEKRLFTGTRQGSWDTSPNKDLPYARPHSIQLVHNLTCTCILEVNSSMQECGKWMSGVLLVVEHSSSTLCSLTYCALGTVHVISITSFSGPFEKLIFKRAWERG